MSLRPGIYGNIVAFLLVLLSSCSIQQMLTTLSPEESRKKSHTSCYQCHRLIDISSEGPLFPEGINPSAICEECHDYRQNHHPVDIIPTATYYVDCGTSPFPLFDGKLVCITCHDAHGGPGLSETPRLLRGGPYRDRRDICFICHFKERYAEITVHNMLDGKGNIIKIDGRPICLFCHEEKPYPLVDRTWDVRFRADIGFLCWRCHPPMPGIFFKQHFLKTPSEAVKKAIRQAEKEMNIILPLVPRNKITCSTCHNPHQKGVLIHKPARAGEDRPKRLRLPSSRLCLACHPLK